MDAADEGRAHWMRLVRCAVTEETQNMEVFQHRGHVYYRSVAKGGGGRTWRSSSIEAMSTTGQWRVGGGGGGGRIAVSAPLLLLSRRQGVHA